MTSEYPDDPQPGEELNDGWTVKSLVRRADGWTMHIQGPADIYGCRSGAFWHGVGDPRKSSYWKLYGGKPAGGK